MPARMVTVWGRVQGVGFRAFVCQVAGRIGLVGEVWNRMDGTVQAIAIHEDDEILEDFVARLATGPGEVHRVDSHEIVAMPELPGFRIGPTRP